MGTQLVRRTIFVIAAVLSAVTIIGGIILDRSPSNPQSCEHLPMNVNYVRPAANDAEREARKKPHYMDVGFGCP